MNALFLNFKQILNNSVKIFGEFFTTIIWKNAFLKYIPFVL